MESVSYDYQLTYLHNSSRDVMGEISGNRIRISIPSLIDNFGRNLVADVAATLEVIILHELSHWAEEKDYGSDFKHSPKWNAFIIGSALGQS